MNRNQKGFAHFLVLVIVIAVVLAGGWFYSTYKLPKSDSPDKYYVANIKKCHLMFYTCPEGYQNFTDNKGCGCEMISPAINDVEVSDWDTYTNEEYGYSVKHPPTVEPIDIANNDIYENMVNFRDTKHDNEKVLFQITVRKSDLKDQIEFEKWNASHIPVRLINEKNILMGGLPAVRLDYESAEEYSYEPRSIVVTAKGDYAYSTSAHPDHVERILFTFGFIE